MRFLRLLVFCTVVCLFLSGSEWVLAAGKARVLLICDTLDGSIGVGIVRNRDNLSQLFESGIAEERLDLTVIDGEAVTWANIKHTIDGLEVDREDALFCHFSGHGAYDPRIAATDPEQGHFVKLHRGTVTRTEFIETLLAKRARLTVLLTDSCFKKAFVPFGPTREPVRLKVERNVVLESLLFQSCGVVDVNGASRDTYCWYSWDASGGGLGGWFTDSLVEECEAGTVAARWPEFMQRVADRTSDTYKEMKEFFLNDPATPAHVKAQLNAQADQRPQALRPIDAVTVYKQPDLRRVRLFRGRRRAGWRRGSLSLPPQ